MRTSEQNETHSLVGASSEWGERFEPIRCACVCEHARGRGDREECSSSFPCALECVSVRKENAHCSSHCKCCQLGGTIFICFVSLSAKRNRLRRARRETSGDKNVKARLCVQLPAEMPCPLSSSGRLLIKRNFFPA